MKSFKGKHNCFLSFYRMVITPAKNQKAAVFSCPANTYFKENIVYVKEGIKQSWNAKNFQFQRKLISSQDRSFCFGANCSLPASFLTDEIFKMPQIKAGINNKLTRLSYLPKHLVVLPSFACNNQCYFCPYSKSGSKRKIKRKGQEIKDKTILRLSKKILDEIKRDMVPEANKIIISGGEPLFDHYTLEFIEWLIYHYPNKEILVLTNGVLLDDFGINRLKEHNIAIKITLYGMSRETYLGITGNDGFERVFTNINSLIAEKFKKFRLSFLICKESVNELEKFCLFVEQNPILKAEVISNCFMGNKYNKLFASYRSKYKHLGKRLVFICRNESLWKRIIRRIGTPINSFKYSIMSQKEEGSFG